MYKYHVQYQALEYINSILPLPEELPLKKGIDKSFINNFKDLIELVKKYIAIWLSILMNMVCC